MAQADFFPNCQSLYQQHLLPFFSGFSSTQLRDGRIFTLPRNGYFRDAMWTRCILEVGQTAEDITSCAI